VILARVSAHAFSTVVALLFGLGFAACGSSGRPPADASAESMAAGDADVQDGSPDLPDDVAVDLDSSAEDATDAARPDAALDAADTPDATGTPDATDAAANEVSPPMCGGCGTGDWGTPSPVGTIPSSQLPELSGLASSQQHAGTLYAHNDSGDTARFFAIDESARFLARIDMPGALAIDWEDIAVGRCPSGWCVFIADIGDNDLNRTECTIYRVPEPTTVPTDGSTITTTFDRLPFVYPDGLHNAETLLVDPQSQRIFVVTKEEGSVSSRVYELPSPVTPNVRATLVFVGTLSVPWTAGAITGGAFNSCGDRVLIRSNTTMFELERPPSDDLVSIFSATAVPVPLAVEPQGEAVTYAADGRRYFTASEMDNSPSVSLNAVGCRNPLR
jgi:hypothetical protein